jgi:hypothetical protein
VQLCRRAGVQAGRQGNPTSLTPHQALVRQLRQPQQPQQPQKCPAGPAWLERNGIDRSRPVIGTWVSPACWGPLLNSLSI